MKITEFIKENQGLNTKQFNPKKEGYIYFICNKQHTILYIGTTGDLSGRITTHRQAIHFADKKFYFFSYPAKLCYSKEAELIGKIKPKYNIKGTGDYGRDNIAIKALRKRGFTQFRIAEKFGVTKQFVSIVLKGRGGNGIKAMEIVKFIEGSEKYKT